MSEKIPDLWPETIDVTVLSPLAILNAQAQILRQRTNGLLDAQVKQVVIQEIRNSPLDKSPPLHELNFDIIARAAANFRERLLTVRYRALFVYPAIVIAAQLESWYQGRVEPEMPKELLPGPSNRPRQPIALAANQQEFLTLVSFVFRSPSVTSFIQAMIVLSNELKDDKMSTLAEASEQEETQAANQYDNPLKEPAEVQSASS